MYIHMYISIYIERERDPVPELLSPQGPDSGLIAQAGALLFCYTLGSGSSDGGFA